MPMKRTRGTEACGLARPAAGSVRPGVFGAATARLDVGNVEAKRVLLRAFAKTRDVGNGYAGIWLRVDGGGRILFLDNSSDEPITGTTDWHEVRIMAPLDPAAEQIFFGALMPGTGEAWFDDFSLELVDTTTLPPAATEVADYIEAALGILEANSIRRGMIDWGEFRATLFADVRGIETIPDSHFALRAAIGRLGDDHSGFFSPGRARLLAAAGPDSVEVPPWTPPAAARLGNDVGYVSVPAYLGTDEARMTRFADELQAAIAAVDTLPTCGWIVDLRENGGGNVFPMIAGIGPILGVGDAGGGRLVDGATVVRRYRDGRSGAARVTAPYQLRVPDPPVAVLIGPRTASSGEATALAFIGRPDTRTFGTATAGFTTGNRPFPLADGAVLNLAVSRMTDRTGREYEGPIEPDDLVPEDAPVASVGISGQPVMQAALLWLRDSYGCT